MKDIYDNVCRESVEKSEYVCYILSKKLIYYGKSY